MKPIVVFALLSLASISRAQSPVFVPETGAYGSRLRSGEGAFLEVQGDIATIALFTHTRDGDSTFYVAGGQLKTVVGMPSPCCLEPILQGYYPVVYVRADLYKTAGGPVIGWPLSNGVGPYVPTKVGRLTAEFAAVGYMGLYIEFDEPRPPGVLAESFIGMSRRNFGFGSFGTSESGSDGCWPDLKGEWVFIDHTRPDEPGARFEFDQSTIEPSSEQMACPGEAGSVQLLTFRDTARNAVMRCVRGVDPLNGQSKSGCELRVDGEQEARYWFDINDVAATRLVGSRGAYLPGWARTDETVTAIRVPKRSQATLP